MEDIVATQRVETRRVAVRCTVWLGLGVVMEQNVGTLLSQRE
jgi:hypothetical protein